MTIPAKLNELHHAENPARELLEKLGWTYVPRETLAAERGDEREVLLKGRLRRALLRLNAWMTESQAEWVVADLERSDVSGMARNQRVHEHLIYGMPLGVDTPSGRQSRIARFFDFDHPEDGLNEFVVTTQFRVRRGNERRNHEDDQRVVKPDLVLFVNGVPLVVMEAKSPSLLDVWRTQAVRQLRRYQEAGPEWHGTGAPELFHTNLLCVAHCGTAAAYATLGAPENAYVEWKSVLPYSEAEARQRFGVEPKGQAQLIVGLLAPVTLLDILRDYVVYEPEGGKLVKKLPRYQQYRAVRAALERLLKGRRPEERGGVVWHTQGSGKSLTMLWLATKLRREPRLNNPTIVVVTDRTQLDRQISGTFQRCGFPAPEQAASARQLRRLLRSGSGRTVMTTIQKFEDALTTSKGRLDVLNPSEQVVVMVDEAHRTQYGLLGARMSKALPNAALIGFTGTPIDKNFGHSTMRRFGSLIDSYTIPQSVADGATVPILYEARLPELHIEGPETLDTLFEAMFGHESEETQARIRRRYANKETVAEAERRIEMIALDIAQHFKGKVQPNGFKAQVVAPSRAAALRYAERLKTFGLSAYPIITTDNNDGPEFAAARDLNQEQITGAFVDPEGEPQILVVVGHAADGVRRARGAGALPGPWAAGTRPAAGDCPREPALRAPAGQRGHGEAARPGDRLSRGLAGPGGGAGDVRLARCAGLHARAGGGSGTGDRGRGGAGRVALQGARPEQRVGLRGAVCAGCRLGRRVQGRPVRALQRGLPPVRPPDGPLPAGPGRRALRTAVGAADGDSRLCAGAVPARGRGAGLDRYWREGEGPDRRAHRRQGAQPDAAALDPGSGLRGEDCRPAARRSAGVADGARGPRPDQ